MKLCILILGALVVIGLARDEKIFKEQDKQGQPKARDAASRGKFEARFGKEKMGIGINEDQGDLDDEMKPQSDSTAQSQPPEQQESEGTIESDMKLTQEQKEALEAGIANNKGEMGTKKAVAELARRWPDAVVPYVISSSSAGDTALIKSAMQHWMDNTCLTFIPRTDQADYIKFSKQDGCWSYVGKIGGSQDISIGEGCEHFGTIVHELGHAIGFVHEQSRPDRDEYVAIHYENIQPDREDQFAKYSWSQITTRSVPYDTSSIMHYGSYYFTSNGRPTITSCSGETIGQRRGLSYSDFQLANVIYQCPSNAGAGCFTEENGSDYRGHQSITVSGQTCQSWTSQTAHEHSYLPGDFPNKGLGDHNYCRNPDGDMAAWCLTTNSDRFWDFCYIGRYQSSCDDNQLSRHTECYTQQDGTDYRGHVSETRSGLTCQNWSSQRPWSHNYVPENYPDGGLCNHNYCRSPDGDPSGAWCITTDPDTSWEYCDIGQRQGSC